MCDKSGAIFPGAALQGAKMGLFMKQLTNEPIRPLSESEIADYHRHGVLFLENFLQPEWVQVVADALTVVFEQGREDLITVEPAVRAKAMALPLVTPGAEDARGRYVIRTFNWSRIPELRRIAFESPLLRIAAQLFGCNKVNLFGEQAFLKKPGSMHRTAFHQDMSYFHCVGEQCLNMWMPIDVVDRDNGAMGYVRGSHRWGKTFKTNLFVSQAVFEDSPGEKIPDIEGNEEAYDIVYYDAAPGDIIIQNYRTLHGSTGNTSASRTRRALAFRFLGEDMRYQEKKGAPPDSQKSSVLKNGDVMDSPEFPVVLPA